MVSCGHDANLFALHLDGVSGTRYGAIDELDAHDLLLQADGFLLGERILTDELLLVELHEDAQACLERSNLVAQLMTIEGEPAITLPVRSVMEYMNSGMVNSLSITITKTVSLKVPPPANMPMLMCVSLRSNSTRMVIFGV